MMTNSTEIVASSYVSYDDAIKVAINRANTLFPNNSSRTVTALESEKEGEREKFIARLSIIKEN